MIALQNGSGAVQRVLTPVEAVISVPAPAPAQPAATVQPPVISPGIVPEKPVPPPPVPALAVVPENPTPPPAPVISKPPETATIAAVQVIKPVEAPVEGIYLSGERLIDTSAERSGTARERREAVLRARPGLKERIGKWFARKPAAPPEPLDPSLEQAAEFFAPPLTP